YDVPSCAAVCVYSNLVRVAKKFLGSSGVKVASVATAFPTGLMPLRLKLQEVRSAANDGADEIDMVINRGNFLAGEYGRIFDETGRRHSHGQTSARLPCHVKRNAR